MRTAVVCKSKQHKKNELQLVTYKMEARRCEILIAFENLSHLQGRTECVYRLRLTEWKQWYLCSLKEQ